MKCPTCDSPQPHLHPAMQFEGEVSLCNDDYHRQVVGQNTPKRIAENDQFLQETSGKSREEFEGPERTFIRRELQLTTVNWYHDMLPYSSAVELLKRYTASHSRQLWLEAAEIATKWATRYEFEFSRDEGRVLRSFAAWLSAKAESTPKPSPVEESK